MRNYCWFVGSFAGVNARTVALRRATKANERATGAQRREYMI